MSNALFYVMPPEANSPAEASAQVHRLACELAQNAFVNQQLVYIHTQDREQAYGVDELLWQFEPTAFVPHNLKGEGPTTGAPVEIGFDTLGPNKNRHLLINLADQVPSFAVNFGQIIDFVANDAGLKAIARERYRQYQSLGVVLQTQDRSKTTTNLV
ncbi:DNA polymerase III subunit chi [Shewanella hanedai]|jgi:DNA polymerase-3 subunit chi|uniref:DNA polymerase III subunit chi n=1 Tax=Shewanella hanedai TaxID=25 RepID=A0A553JL94_SHEHA|nr:DNA polymerase III subunit chi [Shewanella hanedai]TRY13223.1 DNA polymerase III subunit chi [Shewanella hanedai]GGI88352.1 DNA polymerase III subunit chi [Shewanella hanedai]